MGRTSTTVFSLQCFAAFFGFEQEYDGDEISSPSTARWWFLVGRVTNPFTIW
jgi:hypothetical protein